MLAGPLGVHRFVVSTLNQRPQSCLPPAGDGRSAWDAKCKEGDGRFRCEQEDEEEETVYEEEDLQLQPGD